MFYCFLNIQILLMIKYTMYTVNCIKYSKPRETEIGNVKKFSIFVIKTLDARFLTLIKQLFFKCKAKRVVFFQISFESYLTDIFILHCNVWGFPSHSRIFHSFGINRRRNMNKAIVKYKFYDQLRFQ